MTEHREIRRLPSGSIDVEHYLREARTARSHAVMGMLVAAGAGLHARVARTGDRVRMLLAGRASAR